MATILYGFFLIILLINITTSSTAIAPPLTLPSAACSDKLVTFSACLPYVAVSPNNLTESPPPLCCNDVSVAFDDGSAICLCYLVLQPKILGFPLNSTRLLSLTSECPMNDRHPKANFSFGTLCSESAALPPLQSISGTSNSEPDNDDARHPPSPLIGSADDASGSSSTEEPADGFPSQPGLSNFPNIISIATGRIYRLAWSLICFHVFIFNAV